MDPVAASSAARASAPVARAATKTDPAALAGGVAAKGTTFAKTLQAAAESKVTRGVPSQVREAEKHKTVDGHHYARITAGLREGQYLNTSGNTRHGDSFALVERGGRAFHVYGTGKDRHVVEVKTRAVAAAPVSGSPTGGVDAPEAEATTPAAVTTTTPTTPTTDPAASGDDADVAATGNGGTPAPAGD